MSTSKPETDCRREEAARQADQPSLETQAEGRLEKRLDAAHLVNTPQTAVPADSDASASQPVPPKDEAERLRTQAQQLARHFDARQKDLDHREAQISARVAQLECDTRTARLWLAERQSELQRRSEELTSAHREVQQRLARLAAVEAARNNPVDPACQRAPQEAELAEKAKQLAEAATAQEAARRKFEADRRQIEAALCHEKQQLDARRQASLQLVRQLLAGLERRREAIEAQAAKVPQHGANTVPQLPPREDVVCGLDRGLEARQRELQQAEAQLADAHAEARKLQQELAEERRKAQEEGRTQRERWAAEHNRAAEELEAKRRAVERRGEHVDQCRLALQQLRGELGRMHRETLEIRLATEELWVQLSGAAPPAALTRSLGRIRSKLADHYRLANAELQAQRAELEGIRGQLAEQFERLSQQKGQFDQWAAARQEEADKHAARLIAREQQLRAHETELHDGLHRWQAERLEYQHEIRCLKARLPRDAAVPDELEATIGRTKSVRQPPPTASISGADARQPAAATVPA